jgi:hypothetical protein
MALGTTQPPTEMSTRKRSGGKKRPARRADNLAAIYEPNVNVGDSTSRNPKGLHGLYGDNESSNMCNTLERLLFLVRHSLQQMCFLNYIAN